MKSFKIKFLHAYRGHSDLLKFEISEIDTSKVLILLRYNSPTYCNNMLYWWFTTGSFQPE